MIKRIVKRLDVKRLEIRLPWTDASLTVEQARTKADKWIAKNESNKDAWAWEYSTHFISFSSDESWVIVYLQ